QLVQENSVVVNALTHIYVAIALAPDNIFYYLNAVSMHTSQGNYRQATQVYEQMLQRIPPTDDLLSQLANLYIAQKDYRQAIRVYNQMEQRSGINLMLVHQKQHTYLAMNDLDSAVEEGLKLIQAYPSIEVYVLRLVQLLMENYQGYRAIPYLQDDLAAHPGHAQSQGYLAYLLLEQQDYQQAFAHVQAAMTATSLSLSFKMDLLGTYVQHLPPSITSENYVAPAEALCQAHPQEARVQSLCGYLYQVLGNTDQAHTHYQRALALDETNYDFWHNIIALYGQQNDVVQVQQWTQKALQHFPGEVTLYQYLGQTYLQQRQYAQAAEVLEKGRLLATMSAQTQLFCRLLGDAYQALHKDEKAASCYEEALSLVPDDCAVLNNYSYFLALRKEQLAKAQRMTQKLLQLCPDNASYLDTYAWVLYQLGHYRKAKKYLKKALALEGDQANSEIIKHYGDVLEQLGEHQEACAQRKRAKALQEGTPSLP
ncbi:MAG: tetratricopeptide repeat protein, partial [Bacteroidota bacterium]